jgi:cysteine synthase
MEHIKFVGKAIHKNQYDNTANFVFHDTAHTLYQGVSGKVEGVLRQT